MFHLILFLTRNNLRKKKGTNPKDKLRANLSLRILKATRVWGLLKNHLSEQSCLKEGPKVLINFNVFRAFKKTKNTREGNLCLWFQMRMDQTKIYKRLLQKFQKDPLKQTSILEHIQTTSHWTPRKIILKQNKPLMMINKVSKSDVRKEFWMTW